MGLKTFIIVLFILLPSLQAHAWSFYDREKGTQAYKNEKFDEAVTHYENALKSDANNPITHYNEGNAQYRLGHFDLAEKEFLEALNTAQKDLRENILYNLGNTVYRANRLQEAVDFYDQVLKINPENQKAASNKEFVLKKMKDQQEKQDKKDQEENKQENQEPKDEGTPQNDQKKSEEEKKQGDQDKKEESSPEDNQQQDNNQKPEDSNQDKPNTEKKNDQTNQEQSDDKSEPSKPEDEAKMNQGEETAEPKKGNIQLLDMVDDSPKGAMQDMIRREGKNDKKINQDW